jgi:hypothetical protein
MLHLVPPPEHLHTPLIEPISWRPGWVLLALVCQGCRETLDSRWVPAQLKPPSLLAQTG